MAADPFADPGAPAPGGSAPGPATPPPPAKASNTTLILLLGGAAAVLVLVFVLRAAFVSAAPTTGAKSVTTPVGISMTPVQSAELNNTMDLLRTSAATLTDTRNQILGTLTRVENSQRAIEGRLDRVERVAGEVVSRGIAGERQTVDPRILPDATRSLHPLATELCVKVLVERGLYGFERVQPHLEAMAQRENATPSKRDLRDLYESAAVQREALTDELTEAVPQLVRKRVAQRINRDDLGALVAFVWSERDTFPPATPGQLISLATLVGRSSIAPLTPTSGGPAAADAQWFAPGLAGRAAYRVGYIEVPAQDLPAVMVVASPHLAAAVSPPNQQRAVAAYLAVRAQQLARTFAGRNSSTLATLEGAAAEEYQRCRRYLPEQAPNVQAPNVDRDLLAFAADVANGLATARAVREGASDRNTIASWAQENANLLPPNIYVAMNVVHAPQSAYAVLLARDPTVPIVPPVVIDAMDAQFVRAVKSQSAIINPAQHTIFVRRAGLQAAAAAMQAAHKSGTPTTATVGQAIDDAVRLTAIAMAADREIDASIVELLPRVATLFQTGATRDWDAMRGDAHDRARQGLDDAMREVDPRTIKSNEDVLVKRLAASATQEAETMLLQVAARDAVNGDLDRVADQASIILLRKAREYATTRIGNQIAAPMTREDVVRTAYAIGRDSVAIATGRRRVPAQMEAASAQRDAGQRPGDPKTEPKAGQPGAILPLPAAPTLRVVRTQASANGIRRMVIPAGSYAQARVFSGVICELGNTAKKPMLVNLDYTWRGPSGQQLTMPDLRFIVDCTPMSGLPRVNTEIVAVSYTLPDGRHETSPAKGWIVEDLNGTQGVLGEWLIPTGEIIPPALLAGSLEALAAAFAPDQTVTTVNVNTTSIDTAAQSAGQKAANAGFDATAKIITDYSKRVLANLNPSILVRNNQAVTAVLREDVILSIPADHFDELIREEPTMANRGFLP